MRSIDSIEIYASHICYHRNMGIVGISELIFYDLQIFVWLFLNLLLIYIALFRFATLCSLELFLVTPAVAHTRGSRDTNYVTVLSF